MLNTFSYSKKFSFYSLNHGLIVKENSDFVFQKTKLFAQYVKKHFPATQRILSLINNSSDWNVVDLACLNSGITHIPLNENVTFEEVLRITKESKPDLVVYRKRRHKLIVEKAALTNKFQVLCFPQNISQDKNTPLEVLHQRKNNETAVILYTSGSTSLMKGIKHSYSNLIEAIHTFSPIIDSLKVSKALTYLPLSFSGERKLNYTYQHLGIDVCYAAHSKSILDNILLFEPEIMALVPSLLEDLLLQMENSGTITSLKYIVCGGAKIKPAVKKRFHQLGIEVIEVYGLTETASIGTANLNPITKADSAGQPLLGVKIIISEEGEICIHTNTMFQGYLNSKTPWWIADGIKYFRTGDRGYLDESGDLFITGRLNNSIKLSNGTWLQPEELEENIVRFSKGDINDVIVSSISQKLTAIIVSDTSKEKMRQIIDNFNKNSFIHVEDICMINPNEINNNYSKVKYSRKQIIEIANNKVL